MTEKRSSPLEPDDEPMQALIGKQLRTLYDSVLAEPIPDNLVTLLAKLDDLTRDDEPDEDDDLDEDDDAGLRTRSDTE